MPGTVLGAESKTDVVSVSLTPVVWWGRQMSNREFVCSAVSAVRGEGWGSGSPGQSTHLVHWVRGGVPEEVTPQLGAKGQRWGRAMLVTAGARRGGGWWWGWRGSVRGCVLEACGMRTRGLARSDWPRSRAALPTVCNGLAGQVSADCPGVPWRAAGGLA